MNKRELLKKLLDLEVIYKEPVVLRSGKISEFYCDIKKSFGDPKILNALADQIGKFLPKKVTVIASSGYGGLPLAAVVCSRFNKKLCAVRSKEKDHGKRGLIDGYIPNKKDIVVIVDDVLTSGSSIKEVIGVLRGINIKPEKALVVVKRAEAKLPIEYRYIFDIKDLV